MNKLVALLLLLGIVGCGSSTEDLEAIAKKNSDIATVTCNIIGESSKYDAAMRIKEVNLAREKIGKDLYLGKDKEIAESFIYGLCKELVVNDPEYSNKLNEKILIAEQLRLKEKQEAEQLRLEAKKEAEQLRLEAEKEAEQLRIKQESERNQNNKLELEDILGYKLSNQEWLQIIKGELYDLNIEFSDEAWVEIYVGGDILTIANLFSKGDFYKLQIFKPFRILVSDSFALTGTYQGKNIDFITGANRLGVNTIDLNPEYFTIQ